ncbi:MAG: quinolinate synthase NadA [Spirochaetales bacterium]|nr:quinolinate synthase NadA [Leptospiraceae bacterium]MCP5483366.1 quinolinate synthase NadA [Spirochaetales bacterium]MCP5484155.1 quinolinate synthase NadA [Spirochaetales bacterium]
MRITQDLDEIRTKLAVTMMPHELDQAMPVIEEIQHLKEQKNAVVLGHNYMTPDVFHGVSDFVGDSLGLARLAGETTADIILFNGVHFMAETAKIINPNRKVLIADLEAGCSLAESITGADVRELKKKYPGVPVVTYVNCSAEVKAETDVCCTSANALQVVESVEGDTVIFLPDEYLARNIQQQTKKKIISWEQGKCIVHELYTADDIADARRHFDDLLVISHPECDTDVTGASDFSGSTSQMEGFIAKSDRKNIMLVTECSMGDNLRSRFPDRHFISTCQSCPHMKKITLVKVRDALLKEQFEVDVPEHIRVPAKKAVDRMLAIG